MVCERSTAPSIWWGCMCRPESAPLAVHGHHAAVPAQLAGCSRVVLCSPPKREGLVDPGCAVRCPRTGDPSALQARWCPGHCRDGLRTARCPNATRLFGPGNAWVTEAKLQVSGDLAGAAIEVPAGPSEVLVVADSGANPSSWRPICVSQAEHGPGLGK
ncbi:MAG: histidinol dehydrogenase [Ahniella sp.]|nr:histidinol dehydrogenase [Ahniella sp.]